MRLVRSLDFRGWALLSAAALGIALPGVVATSGGLAHAYDEAKAQLARNPLTLTRPPGSKWPDGGFILTAAAFELVVANLLYYRNAYPTVPLVIMWAKNGAREPLASVTAKLYQAALTRQVATNAAVECRDRPHFVAQRPHPTTSLNAPSFPGSALLGRRLAPRCSYQAPRLCRR